MPYQVSLDRGRVLFWKKQDAENFAASAGAAAGVVVSEAQILGSQWVSVKNSRMIPKPGEQVIALRKNGSFDRAEYNPIYFEGIGAWYLPEGPIIDDGEIVTHWMSVPKV